jgi:hypothetical protein
MAFPFQHLCPPGSNLITLTLTDRNFCNYDYLVPPSGSPTYPLYTISYIDRKKDGSFKVNFLRNDAHGQEQNVATVKFDPTASEPEMNFPWMKWSCRFLIKDEWPQRWASDVGTLVDHELEWKVMGTFKNGFAIRCHDVDEGWREVAGVVMSEYGNGRFEVPVHLIQSQNALDEMVVIAMTTMQMQREFSPDMVPENCLKPPYGKKDSSSSSTSTSSSSSSADSHKKKKKKSVWGKLKKRVD